MKLQNQPTTHTCVQTCLAMALDVPVQEVIKVFGDKPMGQAELNYALTRCRIVWNQLVFGTILFDGWHFAVVPSLNHSGGNHQILLRYDGDFEILDPAIGTKYTPKTLKTWECLTPFFPGGSLPEQK